MHGYFLEHFIVDINLSELPLGSLTHIAEVALC